MEKKILSLAVSFVLLFGAFLPVKEAAAGPTATAAVDGLNIRSGPGLSYRVTATAGKGTKFEILAESGEWVQVKLPTGKTGWTASWLVSRQAESANAVSTVDKLRIRKGPGTGYGISGYLSLGQPAAIQEKSGEWARIASDSGNGWVSIQFLKPAAPNDEKANSNEKAGTSENAPVSGKTMLVNADILNVRTSPSVNASIAGKLKQGTEVNVISIQGRWAEVSAAGVKGWASSEFLADTKKKEKSSGTQLTGITGTVTATALSVRDEGSLDGKIIATVKKGQKFIIIEEANNWAKIQYQPGKFGWAAGWYLEKTAETDSSGGQQVKESHVAILYDGTNIRQKPALDSKVVARANKGSEFKVRKIAGSWYEIELENGASGFVAGWIVEVAGTAPQINKSGGEAYLKNKVIVLDPGHGGIDKGTTGVKGTYEKELTLRTATLLYNKLTEKGAKVILTRNRDAYYSLPSRVSSAHYNDADAFISIHYDSNNDRSVRGMTTYYYHSYQKKLAESLQASTVNETKSKNRGARFGDYHVIRENRQSAALIELGYLSNASEELAIRTDHFQEASTNGIVNGLARYFKES